MNVMIFVISGIIAVLFIGIAMMVNMSSQKRKKRTLHHLINDRNAFASQSDLNVEESAKTKDKVSISKKLKNAGGDIPEDGLNPKSIRYLLIQSGSGMPVYQFWVWALICCVICVALTQVAGFSKIAMILWGIIGFMGIPKFILKKKVGRRQNKFLEEFADCLEGMIRLLKSGMPITEAIAMTSREYEGPIGEEMTKVYEDQKVGDTLPEAVQKMAFRVPLAEVKMFSTAVTIQIQTGSSLSEVLQNLSGVIRQRFRLKRKVQALSAEAKISAGIIGCLPVMVIGSMYLLNRDYIELLWTTNTGTMLTYGALTWMSIGVLIMRGMINFKV